MNLFTLNFKPDPEIEALFIGDDEPTEAQKRDQLRFND